MAIGNRLKISPSPCFGDNTTDVKTNEKLLFLIPFPHKRLCETLHKGSQPILFLDPAKYQHFISLYHRSMEIYTVKRVGSVFYGSVSIAIFLRKWQLEIV